MKLLLLFLVLFFLASAIHATAINPTWTAEAAAKLKKNVGLKQRIINKFKQLTGKPAPAGDQQLLLAIQTNLALKQMLDGAKA